MIEATRKTHPDLFAILRDAGYRKHSASVTLATSAHLSTPSWDGGSRGENLRVTCGGSTDHVNVQTRTPFGDQTLPWSVEVAVEPGSASGRGGTFRGKPAYWALTIHPEDTEAWGL